MRLNVTLHVLVYNFFLIQVAGRMFRLPDKRASVFSGVSLLL
jgi:hypothetical protein